MQEISSLSLHILREVERGFFLKHFRESFLGFVESSESSFLDEPYFVRNVFQKVSVVRDDEARSIEVLEHIFDDVFGMKVEVVRWFVHDDDVRFRQKHLGEGDFGTFSSRESLDFLFHLISRDEETPKHRANLIFLVVTFTEF